MDFGIGFLSNNVMLPILDFFYGILPSYGLAIIFLTLVIRLALFPLNAGSIRNMRKMKVAQPLMQKKLKEAQEKYADDPVKMREAQSELYQEFGNPLGGCFPLLLQMPVLFALFATLKGSPFADVPFDINLQILPAELSAEVVPAPVSTKPKNLFFNDSVHRPVVLTAPIGQKIAVGDRTQLQLQSVQGRAFADLVREYHTDGEISLIPNWQITKGEERAQLTSDGRLLALQPGDVTVQVKVPGVAANTGFWFIQELGRVGARAEDGTIHWDIVGLVIVFGLSTYVSQSISGSSGPGSSNPSQNSVNKVTPILFSGMFLFFPLPAGVLIYIVVSNIFQTVQTYFLSQEPLPENLQKLVEMEQEQQELEESKASKLKDSGGRGSLPFER
ncbi:membrane protein insertase YidC [Synechococcus sp. PCC 7336]|uniref:membrane protein insertase YidC n=1 Tax=Synechococcus sp. PCC 7336 TaxID=195250 RepID=UPI0003449299|nr:membrane protein insertase YidC [Synechococcus sp. PCC 7336]